MRGNTQTITHSQRLNIGNVLYSLWNRLGMIMILLLLCVVLSFTAPNFLDTANLLNVLKQVSIIAILAAGMTIVILTGGIDLSVGATVALSGVISVMVSSAGVNPIIAMLSGVLVGYAVGLINGFLQPKQSYQHLLLH